MGQNAEIHYAFIGNEQFANMRMQKKGTFLEMSWVVVQLM